MGKTLLYVLLLGILGAGVYFFVFADNGNPFGAGQANFSVRDTAAIRKIFLSRTNGQSVELTRTDSGWVVNGSYAARQAPVNLLLGTMKRQEAKFPVPENAHNNIVRSLAGNSVKVEVYDVSGLIKTFFVGGQAHNSEGTFMLMQGAQRPYVVQVPGFIGYISPVYDTDPLNWRSRSVFNLPAEQIREVAVTYPAEPVNSFVIRQEGGIRVSADPAAANGQPVNEGRVRSYLQFFTDINAEGYLEDIPGIDSTIASMPHFCSIGVTSTTGWKQQVDIYLMPLNKRSKNMAVPEPSDYDADRFYAVFNNKKDTAIIQNFTFEKLFRRAPEFYGSERRSTVTPMPQVRQ